MESVEFYLRRAAVSESTEIKRQSLQMANIAALREVSARLDEVLALLKETR